MNRLPLLFSLFMAFALSLIVFILSLLAHVTLGTLVFRWLTAFFVFGILGAVLGSLLELVLMRTSVKIAKEDLAREMQLEDEQIEGKLGDLLSSNRILSKAQIDQSQSKKDESFKPAVFPQLTVENGNVVKRGDSAAVS